MATRGKVKWFSESKGYGFIEKEDGGGHLQIGTEIEPSILSVKEIRTIDRKTIFGFRSIYLR